MSKNKTKIPSRYNWIFKGGYDECAFDILDDKPMLVQKYYVEGLKKILTMFDYKKIPRTISKRTLEMFIIQGYAKIVRYKGEWFCCVGSMSGVLTSDYVPLSSTLTNTYLNYSAQLENVTPFNVDNITEDNIEKYCFIIPNDELFFGLNVDISHYARLQTECDLTIKMILYNMRVPVVSVANDDTTKTAFTTFVKDIENGSFGEAFRGTKLFEALKTLPFNNQHLGMLKEVIECKQYLKANFENLIGLNANYNMKRESLNDDEISLNDDVLNTTIDEMYQSRSKGYDLLNKVSSKLYGENVIEFDFNSSWKIRKEEIKIELETQQNEASSEEPNNEDKGGDDENAQV